MAGGRSASSVESNSLPANSVGSTFLSMQVMRARRPLSSISRASCAVGRSHSGKTGCRPLSASFCSRYARISRKNRSPKTIVSKPSATAERHASAMRVSYSWFEQGQGSSIACNGRPAAAACASTRLRRTACIATRSADWLKVVNSPAIWPRIKCRAQALSLPLDQESSARFTQISGGGGNAFGGPHGPAQPGMQAEKHRGVEQIARQGAAEERNRQSIRLSQAGPGVRIPAEECTEIRDDKELGAGRKASGADPHGILGRL